ncbi:MAG: DNA polymerase IV [Bilophila sp.]
MFSRRRKDELAAERRTCQHRTMQRWIMHVDMDAFYASVEQLDNPELRGKPLIVGGGGARGVVSAASYEVRAFGVRSAMPLAQALQRCPQAVLVPVRRARYAEVSQQIMAILHDYSPLVEQASVDEAYLDATGLERLFGPVEAMARCIKRDVRETIGLTCSVGLAPVKFLAKIASDLDKPDGLSILYPDAIRAFLDRLPVDHIPGVGKSMTNTLCSFGIRTGRDVLRYSLSFWERRFGKGGVVLYERAQGIDARQVEPVRAPKSESAETTFAEDTRDLAFLKSWLFRHADRVGRSLRKHGLQGRIVTLKIKYADFRQLTRRVSLPAPTCATETLYETACTLLDGITLENKVRLIGVGVSGFDNVSQQLLLPMENTLQDERRTRLDKTLDALQGRYGKNVIVPGRLFNKQQKDADE